MYLTTGRSHDHLTRTGSASTRGTASGRVDVLPPSAQPDGDLYATTEEQFDALQSKYKSMLSDLRRLSRDYHSASGADAQNLFAERDRLLAQVRRLRSDLGHAKTIRRLAQEANKGALFFYVAEMMLPHEVFVSIDAQVERLLAVKGETVAPANLQRDLPEIDASKVEDLRRKTRKSIGISTMYMSDVAQAKTRTERVEIYKKTVAIFRKDIGELTGSRASLLERNSSAISVIGSIKRQIAADTGSDPDWLRRAQRALSLTNDEKSLTEKRIGQIKLAIAERNNAIITICVELKRLGEGKVRQ